MGVSHPTDWSRISSQLWVGVGKQRQRKEKKVAISLFFILFSSSLLSIRSGFLLQIGFVCQPAWLAVCAAFHHPIIRWATNIYLLLFLNRECCYIRRRKVLILENILLRRRWGIYIGCNQKRSNQTWKKNKTLPLKVPTSPRGQGIKQGKTECSTRSFFTRRIRFFCSRFDHHDLNRRHRQTHRQYLSRGKRRKKKRKREEEEDLLRHFLPSSSSS